MNLEESKRRYERSLPCLVKDSAIEFRKSYKKSKVRNLVAKLERQQRRASMHGTTNRSYSEGIDIVNRNNIKPAIRVIMNKFENIQHEQTNIQFNQVIESRISLNEPKVSLRNNNAATNTIAVFSPTICRRNQSYLLATSNDYYQSGDIRALSMRLNNYINGVTTSSKSNTCNTAKTIQNNKFHVKGKYTKNTNLSGAMEGNKITQSSFVNHSSGDKSPTKASVSVKTKHRQRGVRRKRMSKTYVNNEQFLTTTTDESGKYGDRFYIKNSNASDKHEATCAVDPKATNLQKTSDNKMFRCVHSFEASVDGELDSDKINYSENMPSRSTQHDCQSEDNCSSNNEEDSSDDGDYSLDQNDSSIEDLSKELQSCDLLNKECECVIKGNASEMEESRNSDVQENCDKTKSKIHIIKCDTNTLNHMNKYSKEVHKSSFVRYLSVPNLTLGSNEDDVSVEELHDVNDEDVDETYVVMVNREESIKRDHKLKHLQNNKKYEHYKKHKLPNMNRRRLKSKSIPNESNRSQIKCCSSLESLLDEIQTSILRDDVIDKQKVYKYEIFSDSNNNQMEKTIRNYLIKSNELFPRRQSQTPEYPKEHIYVEILEDETPEILEVFNPVMKNDLMVDINSATKISEESKNSPRTEKLFKPNRHVYEEIRDFKTLTPKNELHEIGNKQLKSKKHDIIKELIETEKTYIEHLRRIVKDYIPETQAEETPAYLLGKAAIIFGNVQVIYKGHKEFLPQLCQCREPDDIAECFINNEDIFNLYPYYIRNKPTSEETMKHFGMYFQKKQKELADYLDLSCYLLVPIQRLGKYPLLLGKLINECKKVNEVNVRLEMALSMLEKTMQQGNDLIAVDAIQNCFINIFDQGQLLLRDNFRCWTTNRKVYFDAMVFLFEGVILITDIVLENGSENYNYKDSINMNDLGYTNLEYDNHEFKIWYRKHNKKMYSLYTKNPDTKKKWTDKIYHTLWTQLETSRKKKKLELQEKGIFPRTVPIAQKPKSEPEGYLKEKMKRQKTAPMWYT